MENENIFKRRRQKLGGQFSRSLFIIPSGAATKRSHSVNFRFKVASDFFYLTGVDCADCILLVAGTQSFLLRRPADTHRQLWGEDEGFSPSEQVNLQGVPVEPLDQLENILSSHMKNFDRLALPIGRDAAIDLQVLSLIGFERRVRGRTFAKPFELVDSRLLVGTLRLRKEPEEIQFLREAAARSSWVHTELMKQNFIGQSEKQVCTWIEAAFLQQEMPWTAYETIVGSGVRSSLLHARATDKLIAAEDMILVDAGGECRGYCADITRVFPAGPTFSREQKKIYQKVLDVQKQVLQMLAPGRTLQELHEATVDLLGEEYKMPHSTSHWLGLDVHDPCPYVDDTGRAIVLESGMVFTVEPGIYLPAQSIGVRIEDDVVVMATDCEVLSSAPKEVAEIEALRALAGIRTMV